MKYLRDPMVAVLSVIACLCAVGFSYGMEVGSKAGDIVTSLQKESKGEDKEEIQLAQCGVTYAAPSCGVTYSLPPVVTSCAVTTYSTDCGGGVTYGTVAPPMMRAYVIPRSAPVSYGITRIPGPPRNVDFVPPQMAGRQQLINHLMSNGHGYSFAYLSSLSTNELRILHDNDHNSGAVTASGIRVRPRTGYAPIQYAAPVTYAPVRYAAPPVSAYQGYSSGAGVNLFGARLGTYSYGARRMDCPNGNCPR